MERRIIKKQITQRVTKKDQVAKHERLVEVDRELLTVANEKAASNADFNGQLKELRKEQKSLLDVIDSGEETLDVDCYEVPNEERMEVFFRRVDSGEILNEFTRPMTPDEREMTFNFADPGNAAQESEGLGDGDGHEADDQEPSNEDEAAQGDEPNEDEAAE